MGQWVEVCATGDIEAEDVMRFDHAGQTFAIYRSPDGRFYATHGLCTHGRAMRDLPPPLVRGGLG